MYYNPAVVWTSSNNTPCTPASVATRQTRTLDYREFVRQLRRERSSVSRRALAISPALTSLPPAASALLSSTELPEPTQNKQTVCVSALVHRIHHIYPLLGLILSCCVVQRCKLVTAVQYLPGNKL